MIMHSLYHTNWLKQNSLINSGNYISTSGMANNGQE